MLQLPNNCRAGNISVFPKNWKASKADLSKAWRINYWFYDDNLGQKRQVVIKMNKFKTLQERQDAVRELIDNELDLLQRQGFNQITRMFNCPTDDQISEFTPLAEALEYSKNVLKGKVENNTYLDIKSCVKYIQPAAVALGYHRLPMKDIKRKQVKCLLDQCGKMKEKWSANNYNHYRKYLSIVFNELVEMEVMELNYCRTLTKQKAVKRIRQTLSMEDRKRIYDHLYANYYSFWRFTIIFFHSGSRETEVMALRETDVNLQQQKFKVLIKKGKSSREEWRTIPDSCIELWRQVVREAKPGDYLFSEGLLPGDKKISSRQITKRWRVHVKEKLGITADFYSLKHSNLDEVSAQLGVLAAQAMAGHSTPVVTMNHYLVGEGSRQHERLKHVSNSFASGVK
ncbi:MAG TPA: tyrosine-type recombinase/integrase [Sediminibacterium sp.]|nr:tyrosine-type recombinase/integrase [Sediminibacterium sp.]